MTDNNLLDFNLQQNIVATLTAPHVVMRPRVFMDGDQWCALYGEDLQRGVAGFGDTPRQACSDFDHRWDLNRTPSPGERGGVMGSLFRGLKATDRLVSLPSSWHADVHGDPVAEFDFLVLVLHEDGTVTWFRDNPGDSRD